MCGHSMGTVWHRHMEEGGEDMQVAKLWQQCGDAVT